MLNKFGYIHFIRVLIAADLFHGLASHQWLLSPFLHALNKPVTLRLYLARYLLGKGNFLPQYFIGFNEDCCGSKVLIAMVQRYDALNHAHHGLAIRQLQLKSLRKAKQEEYYVLRSTLIRASMVYASLGTQEQEKFYRR